MLDQDLDVLVGSILTLIWFAMLFVATLCTTFILINVALWFL